jgi:hypothetical protein
MSYTTTEHVRALVPDLPIDESDEKPTDVDVEVWIPQIEARLNVALVEGGHTSPATDAEQVKVFDLLAAQEAAWMVLVVRKAADEDHVWHKEFLAAVESISDGGMPASADGRPLIWSYTMGAASNGDTSMAPAFTRDKRY